jgi:hypothetical protein
MTFSGAGGTLELGESILPTNTITGFDSSSTTDEIVLLNTTYSTSTDSVTLEAGNTLRLNLGGTIAKLHLDASQSFAGDTFYLTSNSAGQVVILDPPAKLPVIPDLAGMMDSLWLQDEAVISVASQMAFMSVTDAQANATQAVDLFSQNGADIGGFLGTYFDIVGQLSGTSTRPTTLSTSPSTSSIGGLTNQPLQSGTQVSTYVHSGFG